MESTHTQIAYHKQNLTMFADSRSADDDIQARLEALLRANAEIAHKKTMFSSEREWLEAEAMQKPLDTEKAFSYFGLMLGAFPLASLILRFAIDARALQSDEAWIVLLLLAANALSSVAGFFSGKFIGRAVRYIETYPWWAMLSVAPFLGLFWGMIAGGSGGLVIFIIGAFFGAIVGGIVGATALPAFVVFHRLLKRGDVIEYKHFMPLALGVTLTICSFILGM